MTISVSLLSLVGVLSAGCGSAGQDAATRAGTTAAAAATPKEDEGVTRKLVVHCKGARTSGFRLCDRGLWEQMRACGPAELPDYDPCGGDGVAVWTRATIERRVEGEWLRVAAQPPGSLVDNIVAGHWRTAWLSPDGRTLLAQWSGECEVPIAFFLPAQGGPLRPVTGERNWTKSVESVAHGWSRDGRAHVSLLAGGCAHAHREPGRYLIVPGSGELEFVGALSPHYTQ